MIQTQDESVQLSAVCTQARVQESPGAARHALTLQSSLKHAKHLPATWCWLYRDITLPSRQNSSAGQILAARQDSAARRAELGSWAKL